MNRMRARKHLRRLDAISIETPIYFITICVAKRRPLLNNDAAFAVLRSEWEGAPSRYGWSVGRFVVMPDHVHFFCVCDETQGGKSLSDLAASSNGQQRRSFRTLACLPRFGSASSSIIFYVLTRVMARNGRMSGRTRSAPGSRSHPRTGLTPARLRPSCDECGSETRSMIRPFCGAGSMTRPRSATAPYNPAH